MNHTEKTIPVWKKYSLMFPKQQNITELEKRD